MGAFAHYARNSGKLVSVFADGGRVEREYDKQEYGRQGEALYDVTRFGGLKPLRRRRKAKTLARHVSQKPAPIFADSWKSLEHLPEGLNTPVIVYAHGNEFPNMPKKSWFSQGWFSQGWLSKGRFPKQARIQKALSKATTLIAVSEDTKNRATPFLPKGLSVEIIHPPVEPAHPITADDTEYAAKLWPKEDKVRCLVLCRLIDWKGVDMAIRAIASRKDCQLVIAGIGDDRARLEGLVHALGAQDYIKFVGRVEQGRKAALFESAEIFLQAGRKVGGQCEGFGITYVEAALHGLPSLSGDQGGAPEAVIDGETAFVVDATQLENVTEALEKLVINADMRLEMSNNAKAHANALLWPRQINRILAVAGI